MLRAHSTAGTPPVHLQSQLCADKAMATSAKPLDLCQVAFLFFFSMPRCGKCWVGLFLCSLDGNLGTPHNDNNIRAAAKQDPRGRGIDRAESASLKIIAFMSHQTSPRDTRRFAATFGEGSRGEKKKRKEKKRTKKRGQA